MSKDLDLKQIEKDLEYWHQILLAIQEAINALNNDFQRIHKDIQELKRGGKK